VYNGYTTLHPYRIDKHLSRDVDCTRNVFRPDADVKQECVQAGLKETLLEGIPAYPDNINAVEGHTNVFWVGFAARPSPVTSMGIFRSRVVRTLIAWLPDAVHKSLAPKVGGGMLFSGEGSILAIFADVDGNSVSSTPSGFIMNTSDESVAVMGSLMNNYVATARFPSI
jgi:hypothetical protein